MLNREEIIKDVEKNKIIVIMRGFDEEQLVNSVEAMEKGGIRLVEVTFDQTGKVSDETTASAGP
jgi:2-dehydro-3-deoxyphosphogluconate aldolase/(4S)-4-hydroxy-2-oxoglutarate aldolase